MSKSIIAHRGASKLRPENTLAAFEQAINLGADMVEMDVRRDADGELVVVHDPVTGSGRHLPRLEEVLQALHGRVSLDIEIKEPGIEQAVLDLADRYLVPGMFVVSSFSDRSVRAAKELRPHVRAGLIVGADSFRNLLNIFKFLLFRRQACRQADFLAINRFLYRLGLLSLVPWHEKPVYVWTVDDPGLMGRLLGDRRVSGIITNTPDVCRALNEKHHASR